jgi:hypothetical protein
MAALERAISLSQVNNVAMSDRREFEFQYAVEFSMYFSIKTRSSPKADKASLLARSSPSANPRVIVDNAHAFASAASSCL